MTGPIISYTEDLINRKEKMNIKLVTKDSNQIELYSYKIALMKVIIESQSSIKEIDARLETLKNKGDKQ